MRHGEALVPPLQHKPRRRLSTQLAWGLLLGALVWSWQGADIRPMALWADSANMATFARDFFPPDFHD
jgi:phosphonate transport system permease protein